MLSRQRGFMDRIRGLGVSIACLMALSLFFPVLRAAQNEAAMGSGDVRAARRDAQGRPITAGGFVEGAPVVFVDVTRQSGLDKFRHRSGPLTEGDTRILDTTSGGVALFDYDQDGWLDVYLVNGSTQEALNGLQPHPSAALFHNRKDGTFTDVTAQAGVSNQAWGFGTVAGDFDNDGWPDLYVTNFGKNRLYHNNGDGTFTDVAEKAGGVPGGMVHGGCLRRLQQGRLPGSFRGRLFGVRP